MDLTVEALYRYKAELDELATGDPEKYHGLMDDVMYAIAESARPGMTRIIKSAKQPDWWASA